MSVPAPARPDRTDLLSAGFIAAYLLSIDLAGPSRHHNFDGVACAMAVELGELRNLAHSQHVLYGLVGWTFDGLWRLLGYEGRAWLSLATLNGLLHGACGASFFLLVRGLGAQRWTSLLAAMGFGHSWALWFYGLEPQVYPLGLLGLLEAARALTARDPSPARAGLWHALAVGGHAANVLLLPFCWRLLPPGPDGRRRYLAALAAGVGAAYLLGLAAVRPDSAEAWRLWLLGSAATGEARVFDWHGGFAPLAALRTFVGAFWAQRGSWGIPWAGPGPGFAVHAVGAAAGVAAGLSLWRERPRLVSAFALWWLPYLAFFSCWEPDTLSYHLPDLVPFWVLLALRLDALPPMGPLMLALLAGGTMVHNVRAGVGPLLDPRANEPLQAAEAAGRATPPEAWIGVPRDGLLKVYVPYFGGRRALLFGERLSRPEVLELAEPVYVLPEVLEDPRWGPRLREGFELVEQPAGGAVLLKLEKKQGQKVPGTF